MNFTDIDKMGRAHGQAADMNSELNPTENSPAAIASADAQLADTQRADSQPADFPQAEQTAASVGSLLGRIIAKYPRRPPASPGELGAQQMLATEFRRIGARCRWQCFTSVRSLYLVIAIHFAIAGIASALFVVSPLIALLGHCLVLVSYPLDGMRRAFLLRRWLPKHRSQNLLATFAAKNDSPRRRIVLMAHADAACTGLIFRPSWLRKSFETLNQSRFLSIFAKPFFIATALLGLCIFQDGMELLPQWLQLESATKLRMPRGYYTPMLPINYINASLLFLAFAALNFEVYYRHRVVQGANDNLSGCAATVLLAERLRDALPHDVELVCVVTGCEEAGNIGASKLRERMADEWSTENTTIFNFDSLAGDQLGVYQDGDVWPGPFSIPLFQLSQDVSRQRAESFPAVVTGETADTNDEETDKRRRRLRMTELPKLTPTAGATDSLPFLNAGYVAMTLGAADDDLGSPRYWHTANDTLENLDTVEVGASIDLAEAIVRRYLEELELPHN